MKNSKKKHLINFSKSFFIYGLLSTLLFTSLYLIHRRVQTIILGYEIGHMKEEELRLMKRVEKLRVILAKASSPEELKRFAKKVNSEDQKTL